MGVHTRRKHSEEFSQCECLIEKKKKAEKQEEKEEAAAAIALENCCRRCCCYYCHQTFDKSSEHVRIRSNNSIRTIVFHLNNK